MTKKRLVSLLLTVIMLASVSLSGCVKSTPTTSSGDIIKDETNTTVEKNYNNSNSGGSGTTSSNKQNTSTGGTNTASRTEVFIPQPKTYDTSGKVTNLNGRTIYITHGLIQSDATPDNSEGVKILALRKSIEQKFNCKIVVKNINTVATMASIVAGAPDTDIWNLQSLSNFVQAYNAKLLQPIEPLKVLDLADTTKFSNYSEMFSIKDQHFAFNPQLYGVMLITSNTVMYANKNLLKTKGVDIKTLYDLQNSGNWTWDEFAKICKKVTDPASGKYAIADDLTMRFYKGLMASNSTDYINSNVSTGKFTFSAGTEAAKQVMSFYSSLMTDQSLSPTATMTLPTNFQSFLQGKACFTVNNVASHSPQWPYIKDQSSNVAILYMPKPKASAKYKSFIPGACPVGIPVYTGSNAMKKAQETATIIGELFAPTRSQADYVKLLQTDCQLAGGDAQGTSTLLNIYGKTFFSFDGLATKVENDSGNGWLEQVNKIAKNPSSQQSVLDANSARYNSLLSSLFN
jgi:hypothetical protein